MGYRSEVYIGMPSGKINEIEDLSWEYPHYQNQKGKDTTDFLDLFTKIKDDGDVHIYRGDWLKWYEGYNDVEQMKDVVEKHVEDGGFSVCVGEDEAIHSAQGDYSEHIDIRTRVDIL